MPTLAQVKEFLENIDQTGVSDDLERLIDRLYDYKSTLQEFEGDKATAKIMQGHYMVLADIIHDSLRALHNFSSLTPDMFDADYFEITKARGLLRDDSVQEEAERISSQEYVYFINFFEALAACKTIDTFQDLNIFTPALDQALRLIGLPALPDVGESSIENDMQYHMAYMAACGSHMLEQEAARDELWPGDMALER